MNSDNPISAQQIAIWMLAALEKEYNREPDISKCRFESIVFGEVMATHGLSNEDINRGYRFLIEIRGVRAVNTADGKQRQTLPTQNGLQYLNAHREAQNRIPKKEKVWTIDRRLAVLSIIVALIGALLAYLALR
jgi:hypothetical protein